MVLFGLTGYLHSLHSVQHLVLVEHGLYALGYAVLVMPGIGFHVPMGRQNGGHARLFGLQRGTICLHAPTVVYVHNVGLLFLKHLIQVVIFRNQGYVCPLPQRRDKGQNNVGAEVILLYLIDIM